MCALECQSKDPWKAGCRRSGVTSTSSGPCDACAAPYGYGVSSTSQAMFAQAAAYFMGLL